MKIDRSRWNLPLGPSMKDIVKVDNEALDEAIYGAFEEGIAGFLENLCIEQDDNDLIFYFEVGNTVGRVPFKDIPDRRKDTRTDIFLKNYLNDVL